MVDLCPRHSATPLTLTETNRVRRVGRTWTFVVALLGALILAQTANAVVYTYESTTTGAIPNVGSDGACLTGGLVRTFSVPESFTVATIALGINLNHNERGDVRAVLVAPNGTSNAVFLTQSGDTDNNYDVLISTNSDPTPPPVDDNSTDPTGEPYYARLVNFGGANFYAGNASGTWTLHVCDRDANATSGTFNRAKLVLNDASAAPQICASTVTYEWGDNGNNNAFSSIAVDDVTLTLASLRDLTGDGSNAGGRTNFTTQTGVFGAEAGYYLMQFDGDDVGDTETVLLESTWTFDPPVRYETWRHLDIDNGNWEDYVRVTAFNAGGQRVPYQIVPGTAHQQAGDMLESDVGNIVDTDPAGNAAYIFLEPVATLVVEYMMGNDFTNPAQQRIGIGNPTFCAYDYGDAPTSYGSALSDGPRHTLGNRLLYLGANPPDGEADGQPSAAASFDDINTVGGVDDEDGVASFPACSGGSYTVPVNATNNSGADGFLVGYMDWNRDGDFLDAGERSTTVTVATGTSGVNQNVTWAAVPSNCGGTSTTYARFRFTTSQTRAESPIDGATLRAPDGEVEDYEIPSGTLPVTISHVASSIGRGELEVRWTTATESANAGFRVWGVTGAGGYRLLGRVPSKRPDGFLPQRYALSSPATDLAAIAIEDVSLFGESRLHGPFTLGREIGSEPEVEWIDWSRIRNEAGLAPAAARVPGGAATIARRPGPAPAPPPTGGDGRTADVARLRVYDQGVQRVTFEALAAAGIDLSGILPEHLAIANGRVGVPRYVEAPGGIFGPGGFIEFYARPQTTLASPYDVFVLSLDSRKVVPAPTLAVLGGPPDETEQIDEHHDDLAYSPSSPTGDPWYDAGLLAWGGAASITRSFDLPGLSTGIVDLSIDLWGYGDWPEASGDDHHVILRLNGVEIADHRFDGLTPWSPVFEVSAIVQEFGNQLEVSVPGDTGFPFDYVAYDGLSVRYSRRTEARSGSFRGSVPGSGYFAVTGFALGEPVVIWAAGQRVEQIATGGSVGAPRGVSVVAANASALRSPEIDPGVPLARRGSEAEYVIVTHPAFSAGLDDLVALEESRGLQTEVVSVDEIYAAYSDYAPAASALRSFFTESLASGRLRYVLLVGADTTDPWNHLGVGSVSFVPTEYLSYVDYVHFSPTDERLVDRDSDGIPDVPIGRLPVRSLAELAVVVGKLETWQVGLGEAPQALFAAGASDGQARSIASINESYGAALATWSVGLAQVDDIGVAATHDAIVAAFDSGRRLVSFVGHSSTGQWDFTPVFRWQDVGGLSSQGAPALVAQWGCWNSYYVEPNVESLSARLLRQPIAGAACTIGATTLTTEESHRALGTLFFQAVAAGAPTVGDAFLAAKQALAAEGVAQDAILGMALLGDPATPLPGEGRLPGPGRSGRDH